MAQSTIGAIALVPLRPGELEEPSGVRFYVDFDRPGSVADELGSTHIRRWLAPRSGQLSRESAKKNSEFSPPDWFGLSVRRVLKQGSMPNPAEPPIRNDVSAPAATQK